MAKGGNDDRLQAYLTHNPDPFNDNDEDVLLDVDNSRRKPVDMMKAAIPEGDFDAHRRQWMRTGLRNFSSPAAGLAAKGWRLLPGSAAPTIGLEDFATHDRIAYKKAEQLKPVEARHLSFLKVQSLWNSYAIWKEVTILRGCMHPNVIDLFDVFAVDPEIGQRDQRRPAESFGGNPDRQVWLLLHYANAGNLYVERARYPLVRGEYQHSIPEPGALFYIKQICAGVNHLHRERVVHSALSPRNIVLKYKHDGTKVCMVCGFDAAQIFEASVVIPPEERRKDTSAISEIAAFMMRNERERSRQAQQFCITETNSIAQLAALPWYSMTAKAPIPPAPPSPLLPAEMVQQMGYLPPVHPAGAPLPLAAAVNESRPAPQPGPSSRRNPLHSVTQKLKQKVSGIPIRVQTLTEEMQSRARNRRADQPGTSSSGTQPQGLQSMEWRPIARSTSGSGLSETASAGSSNPAAGGGGGRPDRQSLQNRVRQGMSNLGKSIKREMRFSRDPEQ